MVVLCMAVTMTASAETYGGECGAEGDNVVWSLDAETGVLTISGEGEMMLPVGYEMLPWNYSEVASKVTSVKVEEGVTSTCTGTFQRCSKLKNAYISSTVKDLDSNTFMNCNALSNIEVHPDNAYYVSLDGVLFNKKMTRLIKYPASSDRKEYIIPDGVEYIYNSAFANSKNLNKVVFSKSVKTLMTSFGGCHNLKEIELNEGLEYIAPDTFFFCQSLKSIYIPKTVTNIGWNAFKGCIELKEITVDTENKHYLSENGILFNIDKTSLIQYPAQSDRKSYTVPDGTKSIEGFAFYESKNIKYIIIPNSVTRINNMAFYNCYNLKHVGYCGTEEEWNAIDITDVENPSLVKAEYLHFNFNPETDVTENVTPSTCLSQGTKSTICSCGYTYSTETLPLADCSFTSYTSDNNATCIEDGTKAAYCDYGCGASNTINDEASALGHDMGEFIIIKDATCIANGEERADCSRCDYFETKELIAKNHKDENFDGYCDDCDEFIADENCLCVCHSKCIGKLVYKLLLFLQKTLKINFLEKVFGIGQICTCGIAHY